MATTGNASTNVDAQTGTTSTGTSIGFSRLSVIWIQADGTTDIPTNAVAYSNQAVTPTGWSAYAMGINAFLRGADVGVDGGTATAATGHTHTNSHVHNRGGTHTHTVSYSSSIGTQTYDNGSGVTTGTASHPSPGHNWTTTSESHTGVNTGSDATTSDSQTPDPPFYKLQTVQASSAAIAPRGIIALWTNTTAPGGWAPCDGNAGTPNINGSGNFIKGANGVGEIGNTGGATHSHTVTHTHSLVGTATHTGTTGAAGTGGNIESGSSSTAAGGHTHTATTGNATGTSGSTAQTYDATAINPAYVNMFFIMSLGVFAPRQWWRTPKFNLLS